ncbi:MAG: hypothetical protein KatS3mg057_2066 [Herpetosiphonaceae bacterium]|nr:MAG: hypothetical protein KatS3mg057_2066 [Herpetosiphonaceae bacterium]
MSEAQTIELSIKGMDCADCVRHVKGVLTRLLGVSGADVLLAAGRARVRYDPRRVSLEEMRRTVSQAGYRVGDEVADGARRERALAVASWGLLTVVALLLGTLVERLGLLQGIVERIPLPLLQRRWCWAAIRSLSVWLRRPCAGRAPRTP